MVDSAGISFRVSQMGAEGVRARLREINAELRAGKPEMMGDEPRPKHHTPRNEKKILPPIVMA